MTKTNMLVSENEMLDTCNFEYIRFKLFVRTLKVELIYIYNS